MARIKRDIDTKKLLQTALISLLRDKPFFRISVKEICERAGLNRTTFYLHYGSPEDLMQGIIEETTACTLSFIEHSNETDIIRQLELFLHYVRDNLDIYRILLCDGAMEQIKDSFLGNILYQSRESWPSSGSRQKDSYIYTYILQGCTYSIRRWIEDEFTMPEKEMALLLYELCSNTANTLKDQKETAYENN